MLCGWLHHTARSKELGIKRIGHLRKWPHNHVTDDTLVGKRECPQHHTRETLLQRTNSWSTGSSEKYCF